MPPSSFSSSSLQLADSDTQSEEVHSGPPQCVRSHRDPIPPRLADELYQVFVQEFLFIDRGSGKRRPGYSYAQMIIQAILSTPGIRKSLSGIYEFISRTYPFYRLQDKGWQNSVRHNLSLNRYFLRRSCTDRTADCSDWPPGSKPADSDLGIRKGSYWTLDAVYCRTLAQQAFVRRNLRGWNRATFEDPGPERDFSPSLSTNHHHQQQQRTDPVQPMGLYGRNNSVITQHQSRRNSQQLLDSCGDSNAVKRGGEVVNAGGEVPKRARIVADVGSLDVQCPQQQNLLDGYFRQVSYHDTLTLHSVNGQPAAVPADSVNFQLPSFQSNLGNVSPNSNFYLSPWHDESQQAVQLARPKARHPFSRMTIHPQPSNCIPPLPGPHSRPGLFYQPGQCRLTTNSPTALFPSSPSTDSSPAVSSWYRSPFQPIVAAPQPSSLSDTVKQSFFFPTVRIHDSDSGDNRSSCENYFHDLPGWDHPVSSL